MLRGQNARGGLYVTKRDVELFRYLFLMKIATAEQINKELFGHKNSQSVTERLKQLVEKRYLQRTPVLFETLKYSYSITPGSFQSYLAKDIKRQWRQLKSEAPGHDLTLVDIRRRLIKCGKVLTYLTENAIEAEFDCPVDFPIRPFLEAHSDGAILFRHNGKHFFLAIEYENSPQNSDLYRRRFLDYHLKRDVHGVIYITRDRSLKERLMALDRKQPDITHSKFFFTDLAEVLRSETKLRFSNVQGDILEMD